MQVQAVVKENHTHPLLVNCGGHLAITNDQFLLCIYDMAENKPARFYSFLTASCVSPASLLWSYRLRTWPDYTFFAFSSPQNRVIVLQLQGATLSRPHELDLVTLSPHQMRDFVENFYILENSDSLRLISQETNK